MPLWFKLVLLVAVNDSFIMFINIVINSFEKYPFVKKISKSIIIQFAIKTIIEQNRQ